MQTNNTLTKTKKDCKGLFVKNEIFITFVKILNIIKMKKLFMIAALGAAACGMNAADPYKVQVPGTADLEGAMLYIINYDNGEYVDSVLCEGEMTVFEGTIDEPIPARLIMDGKRGPSFILENGSISFDKQGKAFGSPLMMLTASSMIRWQPSVANTTHAQVRPKKKLYTPNMKNTLRKKWTRISTIPSD